MDNKNVRKCSAKFYCESCHYNTCRKSQYDRHIASLKHQKLANTTNQQQNTTEIVQFDCHCGRFYAHRASLYNHKKICSYQAEPNSELKSEPNSELNNYTELIMKLINENQDLRNTVIKQNTELQQTITDMIPKLGSNNNNNKNKFNINVFLNEHCKDALTIEQFINQLDVSIPDLMLTKNKGIDAGISNIFIENMNKLSLHERPMHCSDSKRESVYIKSDGIDGDKPKWGKDEDNVKIKKAIKTVAHVQQKNLTKWVEEHPNWQSDSNLQDEYMSLIKNCTDEIKDQKVIKNLCVETHVK